MIQAYSWNIICESPHEFLPVFFYIVSIVSPKPRQLLFPFYNTYNCFPIEIWNTYSMLFRFRDPSSVSFQVRWQLGIMKWIHRGEFPIPNYLLIINHLFVPFMTMHFIFRFTLFEEVNLNLKNISKGLWKMTTK